MQSRRRVIPAVQAVAVGLCGFSASLTGCAAPDPLERPSAEDAPPFTQTGSLRTPDRWWTVFDDQPLDDSIDRALADNLSLAATWERVREARALLRVEESALRPRVDGRADGLLQEGSDIADGSRVDLGLAAAYEVDLWGRIEAIVESEALRADARAEDYHAAAITLSAAVALTWYELAEARQQLELINSQVETNRTVLEILEKRFAVGQSGSADVLRQRQLIEATREQSLVVQARTEVLDHLLAVLEGRPPQGSVASPAPFLPALGGLPETGVPADLLRRRPDVRSAMLQLEASDADVAAAVADQYPRIDLAAAINTSAENPSGLFERWLGVLAAQIVAPIYDGGRRRAEVDRTVAVRARLLADYGQVVLTAFQEVEDALTLESYEERRIKSLDLQLQLAVVTSRRLGAQYLNGATEYLDVLTALTEQQQLERRLVEARLARLQHRISLYRALAGGFDTPREAAASAGAGLDAPADEGGDSRG